VGVLCAGNVPNYVANHVLAWSRARQPLLVSQIINHAVKYGVDIGELLLEVRDSVHGFLTPYRYQA